MKKSIFILIAACAALLTSCGTTSHITRGSLYPKMYEEKPATILVMPPINNSNNVDAKELLYTSINRPLSESGYYVISPHLAMEIFKAESAYDAELFINGKMDKFGEVFGADAVLFSIIDVWEKKGMGIETKITYIMKSTHTNEILFERTCDLYLDLQDHNTYGGGWAGALASLAVSIVDTALTQHIEAARKCNAFVFKDIPRGKYSPYYLKDMETSSEPKNVKKTVRK